MDKSQIETIARLYGISQPKDFSTNKNICGCGTYLDAREAAIKIVTETYETCLAWRMQVYDLVGKLIRDLLIDNGRSDAIPASITNTILTLEKEPWDFAAIRERTLRWQGKIK